MSYIDCVECNTSFLPFRADQEFCTTSCRIKYNNRKAKLQRNRWKNVSEILDNNIRILDEELGQLTEKVVEGQTLIQKGYIPNYITQMEIVNDKKIHIVVDIIIEVNIDQSIKLRRL